MAAAWWRQRGSSVAAAGSAAVALAARRRRGQLGRERGGLVKGPSVLEKEESTILTIKEVEIWVQSLTKDRRVKHRPTKNVGE
jgi:hypothetical protein